MKTGSLILKSAGQSVVARCLKTENSWERLVGLLNHDRLADDEALIIEPCKQVHTFFMRFAIDVLFVDAEDRVVGVSSLPPWRFSRLYWKAAKVIELPAGAAKAKGLSVGSLLEWRAPHA